MEENKDIEGQHPRGEIPATAPGEGLANYSEQIITPATDEQPLTVEPLNDLNQNMEVHKHPHHVTHKKKWGEYLLEFLMLFLAVFLGFLAENLREHQVEKEREKQYIESMVEDLKADQQSLSDHIAGVNNGILMMDTLIFQLSHPAEIAAHTGDVYYLGRLAPRLKPLTIRNRTYEQLKNSGNFRLIRNLDVSNKIMSYYEKLQLVRLLESINETEFTDYKKAAAKTFDPAVFVSIEGKDDKIIRPIDNPPLRTTDKDNLQELAVFAVYMHGTKKGVLAASNDLKIACEQLIADLQTAYQLK